MIPALPSAGRRTFTIILAGVALTLATAFLWHGPLGAGDRLAATVERGTRAMLDRYEMQAIAAPLHRHPLTRTINFKGDADDFQRAEMVRRTERLPGVGEARWDGTRGSAWPLLVEAMLLALVGFAAGLLIAFLVRLRRHARRFDRF